MELERGILEVNMSRNFLSMINHNSPIHWQLLKNHSQYSSASMKTASAFLLKLWFTGLMMMRGKCSGMMKISKKCKEFSNSISLFSELIPCYTIVLHWRNFLSETNLKSKMWLLSKMVLLGFLWIHKYKIKKWVIRMAKSWFVN